MRKILVGVGFAAMLGACAVATPSSFAADAKNRIEFEKMTWPEVKAALAAGKTTALFYTGGVEQRGPQDANGGHNLIAGAVSKRVAEKLGNAIVMPIVPYTPNNASAELPGTIGITNDILEALLTRLSEQAIITGFKNVVIMGDHGGGQGNPNIYQKVADTLDAKYGPQGIHVYYCEDAYHKAGADFGKYLDAHGYPKSSHGGVDDTSEMMYLGGDEWVRKELVPTALGDPIPEKGGMASGKEAKINNGITGDARRSSVELGKISIDTKVDDAVKQIQSFIKPAKAG